MSAISRFLAIIVVLASCISGCLAEEIQLTGNEARAPKVFLDGGKPSGILVDITHYIEKELKLTFNIQLYPFNRAYRDAVDGKSGIIGLSRTSDRLPLFDYGDEPMFYDDVVLVVEKGKEFPFSTIEDLRGKKLGIPRGASFGDEFDKAVKEGIFTTEGGAHPTQQLAMLSAGRLDAVLVGVGKQGLVEALRNKEATSLIRPGTEFTVLPKPFARDPNYMAFAKTANRSELLHQVDKVLRKGYATGAIPAIIDKYSEKAGTGK